MSSGASQHAPSERQEDFPVDTFRHLESRLGRIRRHVMQQAASIAEAATPAEASVYRVEPEHVNLALFHLIENPAVLDFGLPARKNQITEVDAAVLLELGWERLPAGSKFIDRPPTQEQADQNAKFSVLAVDVEGKPVEFVTPGKQEAPVDGRPHCADL